MKKLLTIFALLLVVKGALAQRNTVLLYGNASYSHNTQTGFVQLTPSNYLILAPGVGYQFNEHWTAGLEFNFSHSSTNINNTTSKSTDFRAGPFIRYQYQLTEIFEFFAHLSSQYRLTEMKQYSSIALQASPGIRMNIKKRLCYQFLHWQPVIYTYEK
jgi:hypothetical protein